MQSLKFSDGSFIPVLGQGTWLTGDRVSQKEKEMDAIKLGLDIGLTLIDTAEMYGNGVSEEIIGRVIKDYDREDLYLVSKVLPCHASLPKILSSCKDTLKRLGVNELDLYLLHWKSAFGLDETVYGMEKLVKEGFIKRWGVSNFDYSDMLELWNVPNGKHCVTNQVLYNLTSRGIEFDLLPWMKSQNMSAMAYCPLAQAGKLYKNVFKHPLLVELAEKHGVKPAQIMLAFVISKGCIAIPKSGNAEHVKENAKALDLSLTPEDLEKIDAVFPVPKHKTPLDIV